MRDGRRDGNVVGEVGMGMGGLFTTFLLRHLLSPLCKHQQSRVFLRSSVVVTTMSGSGGTGEDYGAMWEVFERMRRKEGWKIPPLQFGA